MTPTDLKLYELLGDKTLSFGCILKFDYPGVRDWLYRIVGRRTNSSAKRFSICISPGNEIVSFEDGDVNIEIIGHEPTSTDLFKWMIDNDCAYATLGLWDDCLIFYGEGTGRERVKIPFDLSKKLVDQSEETKLALISLVTSHS